MRQDMLKASATQSTRGGASSGCGSALSSLETGRRIREMPAGASNAAPSAEPRKWPNYDEGDFVIRNYVFRSGETLPELKLHYRALGTARRNPAGKIVNGVLLL